MCLRSLFCFRCVICSVTPAGCAVTGCYDIVNAVEAIRFKWFLVHTVISNLLWFSKFVFSIVSHLTVVLTHALAILLSK